MANKKCSALTKSIIYSAKHVLSIFLSFLLLTGLLNGITVKAAENDIPGYSAIAQTSEAVFYYNKDQDTIIVKNTTTGYMWSSAVSQDYYDSSKLNDTWKGNLKSMFNFTYTNLKAGGGKTVTESSGARKPTIKATAISNGISIEYYFQDLKLGTTIELTLENNALVVNIPANKLKEEGEYGFTSIEPLPFFGAAKDNTDGYIFYPDGSGALMDYNDPAHYNVNTRSFDIYGSDLIDYMAGTANRQAALPVYGIKQANNALFAIITQGEYDSTIKLKPSGNVIGLNTISTEFILRKFYVDPRVKSTEVKQYDKKLMNNMHTVKYYLLDGSEANYGGMANIYRNYLINDMKVPKRIKENDKIPLGLDLFTGIEEKKLIFNTFIPMTTFNQAKTILSKFKSKGIDAIQTDLIGWTKRGQYTSPLYFPANSKLGGNSGLKNLEDYAESNSIKMFLNTDFEYTETANKVGGYSQRNDVVYEASGMVLTNDQKDFYFFNPFAIQNMFNNKFLPNAKKNGVAGVNFTWLGDMIYSDYNKKYPSTKAQTAATFDSIMDKSSKELGLVGIDTGNAYAMKYADRIFNVKSEDSEYFSTTEAVPFYQMVVHGLIPYSCSMEEAGNLTSDLTKQKLKWVEYGYMPYFQLTYQSSEKLKYTYYNNLFTSQYDDWIDKATDIYKEFNDRLSGLWSQFMVNHEKVSEDVYKVTYENGTKVYVNYNDSPITVEGNTIKANDYLVVDKGGKAK